MSETLRPQAEAIPVTEPVPAVPLEAGEVGPAPAEDENKRRFLESLRARPEFLAAVGSLAVYKAGLTVEHAAELKSGTAYNQAERPKTVGDKWVARRAQKKLDKHAESIDERLVGKTASKTFFKTVLSGGKISEREALRRNNGRDDLRLRAKPTLRAAKRAGRKAKKDFKNGDADHRIPKAEPVYRSGSGLFTGSAVEQARSRRQARADKLELYGAKLGDKAGVILEVHDHPEIKRQHDKHAPVLTRAIDKRYKVALERARAEEGKEPTTEAKRAMVESVFADVAAKYLGVTAEDILAGRVKTQELRTSIENWKQKLAAATVASKARTAQREARKKSEPGERRVYPARPERTDGPRVRLSDPLPERPDRPERTDGPRRLSDRLRELEAQEREAEPTPEADEAEASIDWTGKLSPSNVLKLRQRIDAEVTAVQAHTRDKGGAELDRDLAIDLVNLTEIPTYLGITTEDLHSLSGGDKNMLAMLMYRLEMDLEGLQDRVDAEKGPTTPVRPESTPQPEAIPEPVVASAPEATPEVSAEPDYETVAPSLDKKIGLKIAKELRAVRENSNELTNEQFKAIRGQIVIAVTQEVLAEFFKVSVDELNDRHTIPSDVTDKLMDAIEKAHAEDLKNRTKPWEKKPAPTRPKIGDSRPAPRPQTRTRRDDEERARKAVEDNARRTALDM